MTDKHTPGPWVLYDDSNLDGVTQIETDGAAVRIAHVFTGHPDARLIAAAPAMLAALRQARDAMDFARDEITDLAGVGLNALDDAIDAADAAIKAAEGRG